MTSRTVVLWLPIVALIGCGGKGDGGVSGTLVLLDIPESAETGATFPDIRVELQDADGARIARSGVPVTIDHDGSGRLSGVTEAELVDGTAVISGLRYFGCDAFRLSAQSSRSGVDPGVSGAIRVAPRLVAAEAPPLAGPAGPLAPLRVQTQDAEGAPFDPGDIGLTVSGSGEAALAAGSVTDATLSGGSATFDMLEAEGSGELLLTVSQTEPGACVLPTLAVGPLVITSSFETEPVFLEAGRVGVPYMDALPGGDRYLGGGPPAGLTLDETTGVITGTPTEPGPGRFEVVIPLASGAARRLLVHLPVFPAEDAEEPLPFDPAEPGPYVAESTVLRIPSVTTSGGSFTDVAVRVAFPGDGSGGVADGRFPLIAFHHAAHSPADIYDDYTELHGHWASHGFIVASVDSSVLVVSQPQSFQNLTDMSTFQLAAADLLRAADVDGGSPFFGHVDTDRVIVSGHSRGGGATLISLWRDPALLGAMCFEQVSPLQAPGQDFSVPERNGDRPFPIRPILIFVADNDRDEPWPFVDTAREQASGPTVLVTLHGTNHEYSYDETTLGGVSSPSAISFDERHELDQHYTTVFLQRFAGDDLAFDGALFGPSALTSDLSSRGVTVQSYRFMNTVLPVDDFQDEAPGNLLGGDNTGLGLTMDATGHPYHDGLAVMGRGDERRDRIAQWARSRRVAWDTSGGSLTLGAAPGDSLDLADRRVLALRVMRDCPPPPADPRVADDRCPHVDLSFRVVLHDGSGEAALDVSSGMGALGIRGRHFGTSLLPLTGFASVDLTDIRSVELRFDAPGFDAGDIWVDDLRFE